MNLQEAIKVLEDHNRWRSGIEMSATNPKKLTEALKIAIKLLKQLNNYHYTWN